MTKTTDTLRELLTRLRGKKKGNCIQGWNWINPDGPEAADALDRLQSQVEELRGALEAARAWFEAAGADKPDDIGTDWLNEGGWDLEAPRVFATIRQALERSKRI
jgi:hypothetical protein